MSIYIDKKRNTPFIQFQMFGRTYKKHFPAGTEDYRMAMWEEWWKAQLVGDNPNFNPRKGFKQSAATHLYLFRCENFYKIGMTNNIDRRLISVQSCCPYEVELVVSIKTPHANMYESSLHGRFKDKKVRGEWFTLTPDDVDFIMRLSRGEVWLTDSATSLH